MYEKVNKFHPDKIADRIAGALVDMAYKVNDNPHIAVEILIGHSKCYIIVEADVVISEEEIKAAVYRISRVKDVWIDYNKQDKNLNNNQKGKTRCGDNGIFKGCPVTQEQERLTNFVCYVTEHCPYDGKYLINGNKVTVCQSNFKDKDILNVYKGIYDLTINPLGEWTGGLDVDTGATNRKLGSDMGDGVTGGGLHGKDLSKADVTLNICAFLEAQKTKEEVKYICNIGDETVNGHEYQKLVNIAKEYIISIGGFEKFAEYGLIRP